MACLKETTVPRHEDYNNAAHEMEMNLIPEVCAGLRDTQYETPAEIRMLRTLGADADGKSTRSAGGQNYPLAF